MKKDTFAQKIICLAWVIFGSIVCGLGIQITLWAGVGVDPVTLFEDGVSRVSSIPVGTVVVLFNIAMLTAGYFLHRDSINWGSVVATLAVGSSINLWAPLFPIAPTSFPLRLVIDVVGVMVIGLGVAIYMLPEYGIGGLEALMLFLSEKLKMPIGPARVMLDCSWGLIGLFLGGTFGFGTLIGGVGIGMSIQLFYGPLRRMLKLG